MLWNNRFLIFQPDLRFQEEVASTIFTGKIMVCMVGEVEQTTIDNTLCSSKKVGELVELRLLPI